MEEVSHLIIKVSSDDVKTATQRLDQLGKASDRVMGLIKGLLTASAALAVFRQVTQSIAGFQHELAGIKAITSATESDMRRLADAAKELGATTKYSGTEAASGMKFLGQAGFSTTQILAAMPGVLDLATAGELSVAQAADIAATALAGFRLQAGESKRMADALAVAAAGSNTSVAQMGDALAYVAPIGAALSLSIEEVSAALGVLSNAGLQGSMAGTGLRQVLSGLASPTKEAADTLRAYGLTMGDVNPATHSLTEVIGKLKDAGLDAAGAFTIFGDRGAPAVLALTSQTGAMSKLNEELKNGAGKAREMAQVMGDDLTGDALRLKNSVDALFVSIGDEGLNKGLRDAALSTTNFVRALNDMVRSGEAAAWVDLVQFKLNLLTDGFVNASESIADVWGATMEYISGTGATAADDITHAFTQMPENIRAVVQIIGATFGLLASYAESANRAELRIFKAGFKALVDEASVTGSTMGKLLNPFASIGDKAGALAEFFTKSGDAARAFGGDVKGAATTVVKELSAATEAWEEEITAILDERDANIRTSDDKLKKIEELRAAYGKLKAARAQAMADAQTKGGGAVGTAPVPDQSNHFAVQEFEALRKQLLGEEALIGESYEKRLELIRRNTKEGSDLRAELEAALNDRISTEFIQAQEETQKRLEDRYKAEQAITQAAYDEKKISEEQFLSKSKANWEQYVGDITRLTTTGAHVVATKQLEMYSTVLDLAGNISQQLSGLANENSAAAKALFVASKAIAIAQAIVYTELAATRALAEGGLFMGIPMATVIRALGYASVGIMAASSVAEYGGKFEHGGMIGAGKFGITQEAGPEIVKGPAIVQSARSTADSMKAGAGGGVVININNYTENSEATVTKRDTNQGVVYDVLIRQLGRAIRTGGNEASRAIEDVYGMRRGAA